MAYIDTSSTVIPYFKLNTIQRTSSSSKSRMPITVVSNQKFSGDKSRRSRSQSCVFEIITLTRGKWLSSPGKEVVDGK
jgi:hypothetical protein